MNSSCFLSFSCPSFILDFFSICSSDSFSSLIMFWVVIDVFQISYIVLKWLFCASLPPSFTSSTLHHSFFHHISLSLSLTGSNYAGCRYRQLLIISLLCVSISSWPLTSFKTKTSCQPRRPYQRKQIVFSFAPPPPPSHRLYVSWPKVCGQLNIHHRTLNLLQGFLSHSNTSEHRHWCWWWGLLHSRCSTSSQSCWMEVSAQRFHCRNTTKRHLLFICRRGDDFLKQNFITVRRWHRFHVCTLISIIMTPFCQLKTTAELWFVWTISLKLFAPFGKSNSQRRSSNTDWWCHFITHSVQ